MESTSSHQTSDLAKHADEYARREPAKAVISAFGAGLLLRMLPLGAITAALVAIALTLLRPALLLLGLVKVCELCGVKPYAPSASSSHD